MEQFFNKRHAEEILAPWKDDGYFRIEERGVWINIPRDNLGMDEAEADNLRWTPGRVFKYDGKMPEASETPSFPIPFADSEFAAFMVDGLGAVVFDYYSDGGSAPCPDSLIALDPDSMSRTAVRNAFAEYHRAKDAVPKLMSGALNTHAMVRYLLKTDRAQAPDTASHEDVMVEGLKQSESAIVPEVASTVVKHVSKGRQKGAIANIIDEIIRSKVGHSNAFIWEALKKSALDEKEPFTGVVSGADVPSVTLGSLAYTDVKNSIRWYTRGNLTDHMTKLKKANSRQ